MVANCNFISLSVFSWHLMPFYVHGGEIEIWNPPLIYIQASILYYLRNNVITFNQKIFFRIFQILSFSLNFLWSHSILNLFALIFFSRDQEEDLHAWLLIVYIPSMEDSSVLREDNFCFTNILNFKFSGTLTLHRFCFYVKGRIITAHGLFRKQSVS